MMHVTPSDGTGTRRDKSTSNFENSSGRTPMPGISNARHTPYAGWNY